MPQLTHLDKIIRRVAKRVPEAKLEVTDERLPRWKFTNRAAWLEYDHDGKLLVTAARGGGPTIKRKHKRDTAAATADVVVELLVTPIESVE
jgi:hypothetical protein